MTTAHTKERDKGYNWLKTASARQGLIVIGEEIEIWLLISAISSMKKFQMFSGLNVVEAGIVFITVFIAIKWTLGLL